MESNIALHREIYSINAFISLNSVSKRPQWPANHLVWSSNRVPNTVNFVKENRTTFSTILQDKTCTNPDYTGPITEARDLSVERW